MRYNLVSYFVNGGFSRFKRCFKLTSCVNAFVWNRCLLVGPSVLAYHFQRSSLKPLGQSKPNFMWSILKRGNRKLYELSKSHNHDGPMSIFTFKIFFSRTGEPIITKFGMSHRRLWLIIGCIDHGLGLNVTFFTAWEKGTNIGYLKEL